MDATLTLINKSSVPNISNILIFQKNEIYSTDRMDNAWRVVKNLEQEWTHKFCYTEEMLVDVADQYGNYSEKLNAEYGKSYEAFESPSGPILRLAGLCYSPNIIEIKSNYKAGGIDTQIYRDKKLLSKKTNLPPSKTTEFLFSPNIWIGVINTDLTDGEPLDSAIISDIKTELLLKGVRSADIVITGGGPGRTSTPFEFKLENVVKD